LPPAEGQPSDGKIVAKPQAASVVAVPKAPERPTRFTTVEEDEARRAAQHQRSWLLLAGQLAAFVAVLAGLGGVAYYLSRPPSADQLYRAVTSRANIESPDSLVNVEDQVDEFLKLYAADPRAAEMQQIQEQIALDKMERKLLRASGGSADPSLLPVEQMYVRAMNAAQDNPAATAAMLQSLVDLHPADAPHDGGGDADERTEVVVQLARRRLEKLRSEIDQQTKRERAALVERMEAATRLADAKPQAAAAMYRAMVDLYGESPWAKDLVAEARQRLTELEKKE